MTSRFRTQCAVAAAVVLTDSFNPLVELPLKKLMELSLAHGGETFRIPTIEEILSEWQVGRLLSENNEFFKLWLARERGETIAPKDISSALLGTLEGLDDQTGVKLRTVAHIILLGREELQEAVASSLSVR